MASFILLLAAALAAVSSPASAALIGGTNTLNNFITQSLIDYPGNSSALGGYSQITAEADAEAAFVSGALPVAATDVAIDPARVPHYTLVEAVITYSFFVAPQDGLVGPVKLSPIQVWKIYSGQTRDWSGIQFNGGLTGTIIPIVRSDACAATDTITKWLYRNGVGIPLSQVGPGPWKPANPNTLAYSGAGGVATGINIFSGAVGYLPTLLGTQVFGLIETPMKNPSYNFVVAGDGSGITSTLVSMNLPPTDGNWTGVNLINRPGNFTYPIAAFTYVNVLKNYEAPAAGNAIVPFLNYLFTAISQTLVGNFYLTPIPDYLRAKILLAISDILY